MRVLFFQLFSAICFPSYSTCTVSVFKCTVFFFGLNFHCYYVPFSLSDFTQMEDALAIVSNLGSVYLLCIEFGSVYLLCIEFLGIMVNKKFY